MVSGAISATSLEARLTDKCRFELDTPSYTQAEPCPLVVSQCSLRLFFSISGWHTLPNASPVGRGGVREYFCPFCFSSGPFADSPHSRQDLVVFSGENFSNFMLRFPRGFPVGCFAEFLRRFQG